MHRIKLNDGKVIEGEIVRGGFEEGFDDLVIHMDGKVPGEDNHNQDISISNKLIEKIEKIS